MNNTPMNKLSDESANTLWREIVALDRLINENVTAVNTCIATIATASVEAQSLSAKRNELARELATLNPNWSPPPSRDTEGSVNGRAPYLSERRFDRPIPFSKF